MENIFYDSLDIRAEAPIDKRFYIDELNSVNLSALFSNGKYGFSNNVLFNKADKKFYYLSTKIIDSDVLEPSNWVAIESSNSSFSIYASGSTYGVGSCIYEIDGGNNKRFFIAKESVAMGENPLNNPNRWLEVKSSGAILQQYSYRLDPNDTTSHEFTVTADSTLSSAGNFPIVTCYVDLGVRESSSIVWYPFRPNVKIYFEGADIKVSIKFQGDVSDFHYEELNIGQTNIKIEIR